MGEDGGNADVWTHVRCGEIKRHTDQKEKESVYVCLSRVRLLKKKSEKREVRLVYHASPTHIMKVMSTNLRPTRRLIRATKFSLHAYSHISLSCPHPLLLPAATVAETSSSSPTAIIVAPDITACC